METQVVVFKKGNETKGTHVYYEVNAQGEILTTKEAKIGRMYLKKSLMNGSVPEKLKVTVEVL